MLVFPSRHIIPADKLRVPPTIRPHPQVSRTTLRLWRLPDSNRQHQTRYRPCQPPAFTIQRLSRFCCCLSYKSVYLSFKHLAGTLSDNFNTKPSCLEAWRGQGSNLHKCRPLWARFTLTTPVIVLL